MDAIKKHFTEAQAVLTAFIADEKNLQAIEAAGQLMVSALANGKKIISCGNGGSMCDAMHFAEELSGRYRNDRKALAAVSISDPSHISCVGNDYGYDFIFSRYFSIFSPSVKPSFFLRISSWIRFMFSVVRFFCVSLVMPRTFS